MIYQPEKYKKIKIVNVNEKMRSMKGELSDKQSKIAMVEFLRGNVGFAAELMLGIKLFPFQEMAIKGMFNKTFTLKVWGRSASKSFTARIFVILYLLFEPGAKIVLAGPTFRTAKLMFFEIAKIVGAKEAALVHDMFLKEDMQRRNEMHTWDLPNGSQLIAIPLSGEKIRGLRAHILVLDEFLLLPEKLINTVLMPFILSPQDLKERIVIKEIEDDLIKEGAMEEKDRIKFTNNSKMIGLSSASYTFENLYSTYCDWIKEIKGPDTGGPTYFVSRIGCSAVPEEMLDQDVIANAKNDEGLSYYQREYEAKFVDDSDNYFSAKKMKALTVECGNSPTMKIFGDRGKEYVLGIDPNLSNSDSADFFAFCVLEIDIATRKSVMVHSYGGAGQGLNENLKYLRYLLDNFNIVFVIIDNAGADQFVDGCNVSQHFKTDPLSFIDFDSNKEGDEYTKQVSQGKKHYDRKKHKIVVSQVFSSSWIRKANEFLQSNIDHKRIWFGSSINGNDIAMEKYGKKPEDLDLNFIHFLQDPKNSDSNPAKMIRLIDEQDRFLVETKAQCALITVTSSLQGTQSFDLPNNLKADRGRRRARKDNYSALLLANWGVKCYLDILEYEGEHKSVETFSPRFL